MAVGLGVGFMSLTAVAFLLVPRPIIEIYSRDRQILEMGVRILTIVAAFQVFDGCQTVATGALRGLGETRFPMLTNFAGYWLFGLPLGAAMCFRLKWGLPGLWIGLTVALIAIALLLLRRWQSASMHSPATPESGREQNVLI